MSLRSSICSLASSFCTRSPLCCLPASTMKSTTTSRLSATSELTSRVSSISWARKMPPWCLPLIRLSSVSAASWYTSTGTSSSCCLYTSFGCSWLTVFSSPTSSSLSALQTSLSLTWCSSSKSLQRHSQLKL